MSMNALLKILFLSGGVQRVRCLWQRPCWIHPDRTRPSSLSTCWHTARSGREKNILGSYASTDRERLHRNFLVVVLAVKKLASVHFVWQTFRLERLYCVILLPKHSKASLAILGMALLRSRSLFRRLTVFPCLCHPYRQGKIFNPKGIVKYSPTFSLVSCVTFSNMLRRIQGFWRLEMEGEPGVKAVLGG